jgi:hypothetical protein
MSSNPSLVVQSHRPRAEACAIDGACAEPTVQPPGTTTPSAATRPSGPDTPARGAGRTPLFAGLAAAVACLACLVPGLAAGGAGVLAVGALEPDELVMGGLALLLFAVAAVAWFRRRRQRAAGDGCGC